MWFKPHWYPETPAEHLEEALYLKWCGMDKSAWAMMLKAAAMVDDLEVKSVEAVTEKGAGPKEERNGRKGK